MHGGSHFRRAVQKHHEKLLPLLDDMTLPGCFGMTELGHGSNVMGIETVAEYDAAAGEFVITTPTDEASKFWIGGAAQHGKARPSALCTRANRPRFVEIRAWRWPPCMIPQCAR